MLLIRFHKSLNTQKMDTRVLKKTKFCLCKNGLWSQMKADATVRMVMVGATVRAEKVIKTSFPALLVS